MVTGHQRLSLPESVIAQIYPIAELVIPIRIPIKVIVEVIVNIQ